jgi:hypothetical protein
VVVRAKGPGPGGGRGGGGKGDDDGFEPFKKLFRGRVISPQFAGEAQTWVIVGRAVT